MTNDTCNYEYGQRLTKRELQVADALCSGLTNKETGRKLGISHRTVEDYRQHIMRKLGARTSIEMVLAWHGIPPGTSRLEQRP